MSGFSSPPRFLPPVSPRRATSPSMSPSRRGRHPLSGEDSQIRDLSPATTYRAFAEQPIPFDTTSEEFKIFACIDNLTPAEKDLGARVAKAALKLKNWCQEVETWGWSGTFEPPSEEFQENQKQILKQRIIEHVQDASLAGNIAPMKWWGSLLSNVVEEHEARLDMIGDELLTLDVEDLKEHVLDIHGANRSRPSSGYQTKRLNYNLLDDFSILITQTLISALPHHTQLKLHLDTWTTRLSILREVPRFLGDIRTTQKAMKLGWDAIDPPDDDSPGEIRKWKEAIDTISGVLQGKVGELGRRLDMMLDTLEGRADCLPDCWIDDFETLEADFGKWSGESRRRMIDADLGRLEKYRKHTEDAEIAKHTADETPKHGGPRIDASETQEEESEFEEGETVVHNELDDSVLEGDSFDASIIDTPKYPNDFTEPPVIVSDENAHDRPQTPGNRSRRGSLDSVSSDVSFASSPPSIMEDSPSIRNNTNRQAKAPQPPLNPTMTKRRPLTIVNDSAIDNAAPWPPTKFSGHSPTTADDLDRKISDILNSIPAHIRLKSGPEADAPEVKPTRTVSHSNSRGYLRATRSINGIKSPEITLSPAKRDFGSSNHAASGRRSAAASRQDNDIKLYHLTQPGKDMPIKLFIRRVGENGERVMVRVGGGWADLGEYLRQYAEHHGRRTASEGKFEVLGLEAKNIEPSARPGSTMSTRDRRVSAGSAHNTPQKSFTSSTLREDVQGEGNSPKGQSVTTTPAAAADSSAPSTNSSGHRSWQGEEVGLAGPKAKKLDLSGEKLEWIEGMLSQARKVSGNVQPTTSTPKDTQGDRSESRSESRVSVRNKGEFGDLGKVGGTKRVFMRGGDRDH